MSDKKKSFDSPVALVSGASRGIGKAIALALKQRGFEVVGFYKTSHEKAASITKEQQIDMQKVDVTDPSQVKQALGYIADTYGRLDAVVNNAGHDIPGKIESYSVDDWQKMLSVNLSSAFYISKYSLPLLKRSDRASIVNISSRLGVSEFVTPGYLPYGVAKAGLNAFTVGLARELQAEGIRVNAVVPAPTKTDLFDEVFSPEEEKELRAVGKVGAPEEVAELVLQFVGDTSTTGKVLLDKRLGS